jgi:hypothetical protein
MQHGEKHFEVFLQVRFGLTVHGGKPRNNLSKGLVTVQVTDDLETGAIQFEAAARTQIEQDTGHVKLGQQDILLQRVDGVQIDWHSGSLLVAGRWLRGSAVARWNTLKGSGNSPSVFAEKYSMFMDLIKES